MKANTQGGDVRMFSPSRLTTPLDRRATRSPWRACGFPPGSLRCEWRRRKSNPRPRTHRNERLQA